MIKREDAVNLLQGLEEGLRIIGAEDTADKIFDIGRAIYYEAFGLHYWGGDDEEIGKLHTSYREDLITDELIQELQSLHKKYSFGPAPSEKEDIIAALEAMREEVYGEEDAEKEN